MPPPKDYVPRLCEHKGRAYVKLNGKQYSCGRAGSPEARRTYDRLIAEWLARGRKPPREQDQELSVAEVAQGFLEVYVPTVTRGRRAAARIVARDLEQFCGALPARQFGPRMLRVLREQWKRRGLARTTINGYSVLARQVFRWAVGEEMIPADTWHALMAVGGLRKGEGGRETPRVGPPPEGAVEAVLKHLRPMQATLVRVQMLTGMRPGEVVRLRDDEIDRSGAVWVWTPERHKTDWHESLPRAVAIGPQAQKLLEPWLKRAGGGYLFPGQYRGRHYTTDAYRLAVLMACRRAGVAPWSPNQLRHLAATRIRRQYGLEESQVVLGHAKPDVTEIYAKKNLDLAMKVASEIG